MNPEPSPSSAAGEQFHSSHRWMILGLALLAAGMIIAAVAGVAAGSRNRWHAERESNGERVWVEFHLRGQDDVWVPLPAGQPPPGAAPGRTIPFELHRDTGTFSFVGAFDGTGPGSQGSGTFTFRPDLLYIREMRALGYPVSDHDKLLELALRDVSLSFVHEIRDLGYRNLRLDTLIELRAHDVDPLFIRELGALGYRDLPTALLVTFRMYDVSPAFIRELARLHYTGLPAARLV